MVVRVLMGGVWQGSTRPTVGGLRPSVFLHPASTQAVKLRASMHIRLQTRLKVQVVSTSMFDICAADEVEVVSTRKSAHRWLVVVGGHGAIANGHLFKLSPVPAWSCTHVVKVDRVRQVNTIQLNTRSTVCSPQYPENR